MSEDTDHFDGRPQSGWEWAYRAGIVLCHVAVFAAVFWTKANFVSQEEYKADKATAEAQRSIILNQQNTIINTLTRIDTKMESDVRRDDAIKDHETRLRSVEQYVYRKSP